MIEHKMVEDTPPNWMDKPSLIRGVGYFKSECLYYALIPERSREEGSVAYLQRVIRSDGKPLLLVGVGADFALEFDEAPHELDRRAAPLELAGRLVSERTSVSKVHELMRAPVEGTSMYFRLKSAIESHVVLAAPWQYDVVTVWIFATHCFEVFAKFPFLLITSRQAGSGKSTLLSILERACFSGQRFTGITDAALVDTAAGSAHTIILDEFEKLGRQGEMGQTREVLNSLFDRGSIYRRKEALGRGKWGIIDRILYSPTVIAKLEKGGVPETIQDRSIHIKMKRLTSDQAHVQDTHPEDNPLWDELYPQLIAWGLQNASKVYDTSKLKMTGQIGLNRRRDIWKNLLAVAKHISPEAYEALLAAAQRPEPTFQDDETPVIVEALYDFFVEVQSQSRDRVKVTDIIENLAEKLPGELTNPRRLSAFLERHKDFLRIDIKEFGQGATKHVYFRKE